MKVFFCLLFFVIVSACNIKPQEAVSPIRLTVFLDSFNKAYPKYYDFQSTEEQGDSLLKYAFLEGAGKRELLIDFPFVLQNFGKSLEGQSYAHFVEGTSLKPDWSLGLDFIIPVTEEEKRKLELKETYTLTGIKNLVPVTEAWKYNVDLPDGTHNYLIRENGSTKVIGLGTNYATAVISRK